jgi:signal transduction histidine kinase
MTTLYGLVFSFILQFVAAYLAISLTKVTRYNLSWILVSLALILMAIRRFIEILPYVYPTYTRDFTLLSTWFGIITSVLVTIGIILIRRIFRSLTEAERIRKMSEARILSAVIQTEEKERKRFAKDLHDGLGPILSTVKMSLSALQRSDRPERNEKIIKNTSELINEAIGSLKEITDNISPHILTNFGLETMLNSFINKINYAGKIQVNLKSNLKNERFIPEVEVILYRSICELINNTIQYANAKTIDVNLFRTPELLLINYKDDGKGFDTGVKESDEIEGSGFYNIQSRINSIRGNFTLQSNPGMGMEATIVIKSKDIKK